MVKYNSCITTFSKGAPIQDPHSITGDHLVAMADVKDYSGMRKTGGFNTYM